MNVMNKALLSFLVLIPGLLASLPATAQLAQPIIRYEAIHQPVIGYHGMAVSQNERASSIGSDILKQGGNAVDAAVAMGFALAVTLPRAGNIGGSGYMLIHLAGENRTIALDYRSIAPLNARPEDIQDKSGDVEWDKLTFGPHASAIPGTVAGLHQAWKEHGSLPWANLVQPAIELAEKGIEVTTDLNFALEQAGKVLAATPASAAIYLHPDGYAWQPGHRLVQKDLAWSLKEIQRGGADAFYRGELGERIVAAYQAAGRDITMQDLAAYRVREREPVATTYRGHRVVSMPPSSAGGITLIQMLNMLSHFDVAGLGAGTAKQVHLLAEVMKRGAANRRTWIGDPDFVDVPVAAYISAETARALARDIDLQKASRVEGIAPYLADDPESRDTTHYSVMDAQGNAVSNTYTLGYSFGSGWVADGTGILLDNQMRNFRFSNEGGMNALEPGKRMISTMTPTLVLDEDGKVFMVTGTPGGSRIINVILQLIVNVLDNKLDIAEATQRPRIYQGWRSQVLELERGYSEDTADILKSMGHEIRFEQTMGSTQSILFMDGKFHGSADSRRPNALAVGVIVPPRPREVRATGTRG